MSGLAAAYELATGGADVIVLEGSDRLGGKLKLGSVGDLTLDLGAESMLARRPEALDLVHAVGLDDHVVNPHTITASIWTHGVAASDAADRHGHTGRRGGAVGLRHRDGRPACRAGARRGRLGRRRS